MLSVSAPFNSLFSLWDYGICSFSLQYFVMICILHTVFACVISLSCALFHTNWTEYSSVHSAADTEGFFFKTTHHSWIVLKLLPSLVKSGLVGSAIGSNKNIHLCWGRPMCTNVCCMVLTHSLTDEVILTCTRPPLPSHWSRSPDSCPCSLPAPGHSQKSPCKCSHTSHLQSLLTPSGTGTLHGRHRGPLIWLSKPVMFGPS